MQLLINPSSGIPIYKQVYDQLERMIINHNIAADSFLPSVRQLAIELEVNPMTISKAYSLLEERGYLVRQRGKGMAVSTIANDQTQAEKLALISTKIESLVLEATQMGISLTCLKQQIEQTLNSNLIQSMANNGDEES